MASILFSTCSIKSYAINGNSFNDDTAAEDDSQYILVGEINVDDYSEQNTHINNTAAGDVYSGTYTTNKIKTEFPGFKIRLIFSWTGKLNEDGDPVFSSIKIVKAEYYANYALLALTWDYWSFEFTKLGTPSYTISFKSAEFVVKYTVVARDKTEVTSTSALKTIVKVNISDFICLEGVL